ncbi:hypothetical protein ACFL0V_05920 [Nanoarchaeota archaeon]
MTEIDSLDPECLEEFEQVLKKVKQTYARSPMKLMHKYLKLEQDYENKIQNLEYLLQQRITKKFQALQVKISALMNDIEAEDPGEKKRFEEAAEAFKLLVGFHQRWKHIRNFSAELNDLRIQLANKHTRLLHTLKAHKHVYDYKDKLIVLQKLGEEIDRLYDWYCTEYLNLEDNPHWHNYTELDHGTRWMHVDFHTTDPGTAPLEHMKKIPTREEVAKMQDLFSKFLHFYTKHDLISHDEIRKIENYDSFTRMFENHTLHADDAEERFKAALLEQVGTFHTLIQDANGRHNHKLKHEQRLNLGFVSYFAPLDEIYNILSTGVIHSQHSLSTKVAGINNGIILNMFPKIEHGDAGFIFPITKIMSKHLFTQLTTEDGSELHVFHKDPDSHIMVDIRDAIFIAPKEKLLKFQYKGYNYEETYEKYFLRFFKTLARIPPKWFDPTKLEGWLSRHCIFYDDDSRKQLLRMLDSRSFASVIDRFTNKKLDNLAFSQIHGQLTPTEHYQIYEFLEADHPNPSKYALTLFRWDTKP